MLELTPEELLQELKPIFYPESIAVVGASQHSPNAGTGWVLGLVNTGFRGNIYPVNPRGGEIFGLKIYPNLTAIPGTVDYVVVSIPREAVPNLLDDCVTKKIKAIHFFTAGFSEMDEAGRKLEEEMVKKARQGGFHIIGPNCIGNYCPESRIPYGPMGTLGDSGRVGFVSQSGGIGGKLAELGMARGINYSKGISFGNGIELDAIDFLRYMAADPKTSIIGTYLEGTRNGRLLFDTMREVTKTKPLIVLKGGRTDVGAAAAHSHTGSLASSATTWSAAVKQAGAIEVYSVEELTDTMLIFQQLGRWQGKGISIVGGLADGGGGISVTAADVFAEVGLNVPQLSPTTKERLNSLIGPVGSILRNPVDVSQAGGRLSTLDEIFKAILADPVIDMLIVQQDMGILLIQMSLEAVETINNSLLSLRAMYGKPIVIVLPPGVTEPQRLQIEQKLTKSATPVFPTMERAAKAISHLSRYSQFEAALRS
jgi:acyl-CoA synthetase (NDP forming)